MSHRTSVSVFGPGALGGAIIDLISRHSEFILHSVWGQSESYIYSGSGTVKRPAEKSFPVQTCDLGNLVILTVPDDQLSPVVDRLAKTDLTWADRNVVHLSGSHNSSILQPLADYGAGTASIHPLQTFTRSDNAVRFDGIWFTFQGDDSLFPLLKNLITPFGARSIPMSADQKSAMHLAAVFASNYLVSLMEVVQQITEKQDIQNGLELLSPIIHQTLENIFEKGPGQSLSGPVARGDRSTLEKHLNQLVDKPDHAKLYRQLGVVALQIAQKSGQLNAEKARQILLLLEPGSNE